MSSQASREGILKEIKSIRVGKEQQLRQVHVPENAYKMARIFLKWAPNYNPDHQPIRFKKLCCLSEGDTIYTLLIRDAGDTPLGGAKDKIVDWKAATNAFTRYALNLLLAPNRPEFLRMKLSTSFYIYQVAKKLKEAEKILVCMGYICSAEPYEVQEYKYAGDVKTEHIAEVLADLVIVHSELDLIQGIVHGAINEKYVNILLCDILRARAHPHEDLVAALQSSAGEAHRRMYASKVRSELSHSPQLQRHQSPQLQHAQHAVTVPQPSGSGQQFHQTTAPAAYYAPQNRLSPRSSPSIQRRTQNAQANAETLCQQNNLGVPAQTVSQQHVHQNVYHNIPFSGAQSTNTAPPNLSQQQPLYVNRDFKSQYADSKGLNKDIPKQPSNMSAPGTSPKDPYNYHKIEVGQRPHADSKPPDPMDLPEPAFDGNNPPPPLIETYSDNLSLMLDTRSVQSGLSGPNLDSMLSSDRLLGDEFQPGVHVPGYDFNNTNAQAQGNISKPTHHSSEKYGERETPKAEEKHLTPASEPQGSTQNPYCNCNVLPGEPPAVDPQTTAHREKTKDLESRPKVVRKPKPTPRQNLDIEYSTSEIKLSGMSDSHAQGASVTSTSGDQNEEPGKPHSSPHPSLESDSAPPSYGAEYGQPDSGPHSNEELSTPSGETLSVNDQISTPVRERSNAISETKPTQGLQSTQTPPDSNNGEFWVCEYCTNMNKGGTHCEVCPRERKRERKITLKETTV